MVKYRLDRPAGPDRGHAVQLGTTESDMNKNPPQTKIVRKANGSLDEHEAICTEAIIDGFKTHLKYTLAKDRFSSTDYDRYYALSMTVRDRLVERWISTSQTYYQQDAKRVYYLSMEYLMGRALGNNVGALYDNNIFGGAATATGGVIDDFAAQ